MAKGSTKRRKRSTSRKASRGGMAPWYLAAAVIVGGIVAYDHRGQIHHLPGAPEVMALLSPAEKEKKVRAVSVPVRPREHTGSIARKPALAPPAPIERPMDQPAEQPAARLADSSTFYFCGIRHDNCVIDGDTFLFNGERILIADIDAPETKRAKCDEERSRGSYAKTRLRELLNAGKFTLVASKDRAGDDEAGKPRLVVRDGRSLGDVLVAEGLVRKRIGRPFSWCGRSTTAPRVY
ncbi:thermonuclease family protein [Sinorhizobium numidicum]|uniref:Thermonuclease family protein n=1 Tax=Sinorhizobium numidicum TaxID=680248 RepID=A0ABY8CW82_9HYPH|nr:thermonuclease family protein [Sinorhizobium numidicum]WEX76237.1 thermonuclease family protein [Sinorhizobium numidicum]WEX82896.1 thermonuclease family protein [Sinorhizobium numidicum]